MGVRSDSSDHKRKQLRSLANRWRGFRKKPGVDVDAVGERGKLSITYTPLVEEMLIMV